MLNAVLFDWDGTLLDSAEAGLRSYECLFASYGIAFDRARFAETSLSLARELLTHRRAARQSRLDRSPAPSLTPAPAARASSLRETTRAANHDLGHSS